MAKDDLLKEAIADAKAVRETALANAKAALSEAFTPKLQSMLNATLQNENEFDVQEEDYITGERDEDEEGLELDPEDEIETDPDAEEMAEKDFSEEEFGEEEFGEEEFGEEEFDDESGDESDEEFSLESIVKELEEEADSVESMEDPLQENEKDDDDDDYYSFGAEGRGEEWNEGVDEDVNLEELINELKKEYYETADTSNSEMELMETKKTLKEYVNVVKYLRTKLNEVNLLNAKLLFTNKLFKNHNMNESQKLRVIETLDRATTLKECKLVYSTLEEAYNGMKSVARKTPARKIVESMASHPIESTRPSQETVDKTVMKEEFDLAARFKQLAGITKPKII